MAPPVASPDTARWYCVRTNFGAERLAATEIGLAGFDVFAPRKLYAAEPAFLDGFGTVRPSRGERLGYLFPRYLFARFLRSDAAWRRIPTLEGVDRLMSHGPESPTPMPDHAIDLVRSMCSANGVVYPPDRQAMAAGRACRQIAIGAAARVVEGPMADLVGICEQSDAQRVRLLMAILGREVRVTVPAGLVEAIEAS